MERKITLVIDEKNDLESIEHVLKKKLGFSSGLVARLKQSENSVLNNGASARMIDCVKTGDVLTVRVKEKNSSITAKNIPLEKLYEDEDILAVNKKSGILSHPSRYEKDNTLINAVAGYIKGNAHIITRLDKDTSGVVLIAKNAHIANLLTEKMKEGEIKKEYVALLCGNPKLKKGTIDAPIEREENGSIKRCVREDGKSAVTKYEVTKEGDISFCKLFPITGRTHQLRVHMKHIGTPICGDKLYGNEKNGNRLCLHCKKISFCHPMTGKNIIIEAEIPKDMII